jgi:hypothetical protein
LLFVELARVWKMENTRACSRFLEVTIDLDNWEPSPQNGATIPAFQLQDSYFSTPCGGEMVYRAFHGLGSNSHVGYAPINGMPLVPWFQEALNVQELLG